MSNPQTQEMEVFIRARYPILYIVSWEEERAVQDLVGIGQRTGKKVYEWSCSSGIVPAGMAGVEVKTRNTALKDPLLALNEVVEQKEGAIYIFKDFHPFLGKNNFAIIRKLRDIAHTLKSSFKTLVLVSPFLNLPQELEKDITVIDYKLPNLQELCALLNDVISQVKDNPNITVELDDEGLEEILKAALGLTLAEAENVFAKALVTGGKLDRDDVAAIFAEKRQIIRKSGLLDYCDPEIDFTEIGGLENLKEWLGKRKLAFTEKAQEFGLPAPRGAMLLGVQGCGKSLCAKAVSQHWRLPLLRLDVGRLFSSLVGSSEENIRRAISTAESIAPCVLWVDEIDKAFGSLGGSSTDSGTSQRVLGTFLTWMGEKCSPVFVVATANNIRVLPPEFLRKGRFDEIFFVDLPNAGERQDILKIHLEKRGRKPDEFDIPRLARECDGFSGAEMEQVVVAGLFDAFYAGRQLADDDLSKAIRETIPLSVTMEEQIRELREWCQPRARHASILQDEYVGGTRRRFEFAASEKENRP